MPDVSFIVPVYNAIDRLERCVFSLMNQTAVSIEIILVDDGSTDGSEKLCDALALQDARICVIHQPNGGVSSARNKGLSSASGNWIMFVDADDWIDHNTVQFMLEQATKNRADIEICGFCFEYKTYSHQFHISEVSCTPREIYTQYKELNGLSALLCSPCNKLYKRDILVNANCQFLIGIKFGEDFIYNTAVFRAATHISSVDYPFYHYDCTQEDSGVNKLYFEYDKYLHTMEDALLQLLSDYNISEEAKKDFFGDFMSERWVFATEVCLNSILGSTEKTELLIEWYSGINPDLIPYIKARSSKYEKLISELTTNKGSCRKATVLIKNIAYRERVDKSILKLKVAARKVLGR